MEKYKATKNNNNEEVPEKTEKEKKQESTEKLVDMGATIGLDAMTGGQFSTVKDMASNVPIVGKAANGVWNKAVSGVSEVVSKTPVGDVAKGLDDSGITDVAKTGYDAFRTVKSGGANAVGKAGKVGNAANNAKKTENIKNGFSKSQKKSNLTSSSSDGSFLSKNIMSSGSGSWKLKLIVVISGFILIIFMGAVGAIAGKDAANLDVTNKSQMARKSAASADVMKALEEVANWYIDNVADYGDSYVQSPFASAPVRIDCTGFAVAYMSYVAGQDVPDSYTGNMIYPDGDWAKSIESLGWIAYTSDEIGDLQPGDVLVSHSGALYSTKGKHAEIYVDENHTFGWGSVKHSYPTSSIITASEFGGHVHFMDNSHDYITVYRYAGAVNLSNMNIKNMNDSSFNHGTKPKSNQKYIMLHDTEMPDNAEGVVNSWKNSGSGVAAHFVIDRDGTIIQAVDLDVIAHHAGYGGPGDYDSMFNVGNNDGQGNGDDLVGTVPLSGYTSYGMNSYSIGIEMCHVNGEEYPEELLKSLDQVILYIDSYYGFKSEIIDHKAWRPSNSDTDVKFATYLNNYKTLRHY